MPAVAAAVGATVLLAACGLPTSGTPQAIPRGQVPFQLLAPNLSSTTTTAPLGDVTVPIFLVDPSQHLTPRQRDVASPAPLASVINALLAGPTSSETAVGIQTSIGDEVRLLSATVSGDVATVDFNRAFGEITGTQQVLAVAQVVYTTTQQPGVSGVIFEIAGARTEVPVGSGAQVAGPVVRSQFAAQAPVIAAAPVTTTT